MDRGAEMNKTLEYYKAMENIGCLLELPCAVGSRVYEVDKKYGDILSYKVDTFTTTDTRENGKRLVLTKVHLLRPYDIWGPNSSITQVTLEDFSKTFFCSREEAAQAFLAGGEAEEADNE